jgi:hypothetical protein
MDHILDDTYIPYKFNKKYPPIKPSSYDSYSNKIHKLMAKQSTMLPISVLNELSQLLHLAKPKYTLYNHHSGLYLCRVDFAGSTFRTSTPKYHSINSKNDAAEIALDFFSNLSTVPCQETTHTNTTRPQIPVMTPDKSYISLLFELCEMKGLGEPVFIFEHQALNSRFICNIRIEMCGLEICYNGSKTFERKRCAKEHAAKAMYEKLTTTSNV